MIKRPSYLPDNFILLIIGMVVLASFIPAHGRAVPIVTNATNLAVALLFFLHGARLSHQAMIAGAFHWRLQLTIVLATFAFFPLLGLAIRPLCEPLLGSELYMGILYICALPSTVQSSIAFTSIARGNVPAAICAASFSNLLGIFATPILVGILFSVNTGADAFSLDAVYKIILLLLVPFLAGQLLRKWIGQWVMKNSAWLKHVDKISILLVVYSAFSDAVVDGIWKQLDVSILLLLTVICIILLFIVMFTLTYASRKLGFNKEDEIAIVFCGSKKSLASGVPIAQILFVGHPIGMLILPIMIFHQFQLMVCSFMAQRYAKRAEKNNVVHE